MRIGIATGTILALGLAGCSAGTGGETYGNPVDSDEKQARSAKSIKLSASALGEIVTDQDGRTLYAFTKDKEGVSNCAGNCIATWPALVSNDSVSADEGVDESRLGNTKRAEGAIQATYGGWPLYYFVGDKAPGDVDGQGVDGTWFAVGADGKLIKK